MTRLPTPYGGNDYGAQPPFIQPLRPFQYPSVEHLFARVTTENSRAVRELGLKPSTVAWYADAIRSLRTYLLETHAGSAFVSGDLATQRKVLLGWRGWLLERGARHVSIRTYWRSINVQLARLEAADGVMNPMRWIEPPRVGKLLPKALTRDAARTVLSFVQNHAWPTEFLRARNTAIVATMLLAGLRRMEVIRLERHDYDADRHVLAIHASKGAYGGKDRTAYVNRRLASILDFYLDHRARLQPIAPALFVSTNGKRSMGVGGIQRIFRVITDRTGVRVSPHRLRHTFATLLRQSGVSDRVSMDLLGHEDLGTLQRYSGVFEPEYAEAIEKLSLGDD